MGPRREALDCAPSFARQDRLAGNPARVHPPMARYAADRSNCIETKQVPLYNESMQSASRPRLFFIDNLRIPLIALVVAHHAGQAYGPTGGWWYFSEPARAAVLGAFFTVNRSFFMSLFFMVSGYFLPMSSDRKTKDFLKDRFTRLGIPLLFFFFVVIPVLMYVYHVNFRPYGPISFFSYYGRYYLGHGPRPLGWVGGWPDKNFGHLWFVEHLLIFAVCYRLWRLMPFSGRETGQGEGRPPKSVEDNCVHGPARGRDVRRASLVPHRPVDRLPRFYPGCLCGRSQRPRLLRHRRRRLPAELVLRYAEEDRGGMARRGDRGRRSLLRPLRRRLRLLQRGRPQC